MAPVVGAGAAWATWATAAALAVAPAALGCAPGPGEDVAVDVHLCWPKPWVPNLLTRNKELASLVQDHLVVPEEPLQAHFDPLFTSLPQRSKVLQPEPLGGRPVGEVQGLPDSEATHAHLSLDGVLRVQKQPAFELAKVFIRDRRVRGKLLQNQAAPEVRGIRGIRGFQLHSAQSVPESSYLLAVVTAEVAPIGNGEVGFSGHLEAHLHGVAPAHFAHARPEGVGYTARL